MCIRYIMIYTVPHWNCHVISFHLMFWLVVDLPLWKMMEFVSWGYYSQLNGKIKFMLQTTNQCLFRYTPLELSCHIISCHMFHQPIVSTTNATTWVCLKIDYPKSIMGSENHVPDYYNMAINWEPNPPWPQTHTVPLLLVNLSTLLIWWYSHGVDRQWWEYSKFMMVVMFIWNMEVFISLPKYSNYSCVSLLMVYLFQIVGSDRVIYIQGIQMHTIKHTRKPLDWLLYSQWSSDFFWLVNIPSYFQCWLKLPFFDALIIPVSSPSPISLEYAGIIPVSLLALFWESSTIPGCPIYI